MCFRYIESRSYLGRDRLNIVGLKSAVESEKYSLLRLLIPLYLSLCYHLFFLFNIQTDRSSSRRVLSANHINNVPSRYLISWDKYFSKSDSFDTYDLFMTKICPFNEV